MMVRITTKNVIDDERKRRYNQKVSQLGRYVHTIKEDAHL
jgi:hypothetical protein